jgi:hypothetical protein
MSLSLKTWVTARPYILIKMVVFQNSFISPQTFIDENGLNMIHFIEGDIHKKLKLAKMK